MECNTRRVEKLLRRSRSPRKERYRFHRRRSWVCSNILCRTRNRDNCFSRHSPWTELLRAPRVHPRRLPKINKCIWYHKLCLAGFIVIHFVRCVYNTLQNTLRHEKCCKKHFVFSHDILFMERYKTETLVVPSLCILYHQRQTAGLGGSVGCAVRRETRRSRVQPPPRSATFFRGDWSGNIFYGHSLPSADSRRAVVSFWRKNVHNTG